MSSPQVNSGGRDNSQPLIPAAAALLSRAFMNDPFMNYLLSAMPAAKRAAYIPRYFELIMSAAVKNHGTIDSIADRIGNGSDEGEGGEGEWGPWKSCAVLIPPGERIDNPWRMIDVRVVGMVWNVKCSGLMRMLHEYPSATQRAKRKGLKGHKRYHYVFCVGTEAADRGQGLCSAIMRDYQARAEKDGLPIWLEATTEKSRGLYANLGWELVEEMVMGKGKATADGTLMKGGEGVKLWAMVWWPPAKTGES